VCGRARPRDPELCVVCSVGMLQDGTRRKTMNFGIGPWAGALTVGAASSLEFSHATRLPTTLGHFPRLLLSRCPCSTHLLSISFSYVETPAEACLYDLDIAAAGGTLTGPMASRRFDGEGEGSGCSCPATLLLLRGVQRMELGDYGNPRQARIQAYSSGLSQGWVEKIAIMSAATAPCGACVMGTQDLLFLARPFGDD
jgi:hypothetical protein